jgi:hypothetical protein
MRKKDHNLRGFVMALLIGSLFGMTGMSHVHAAAGGDFNRG